MSGKYGRRAAFYTQQGTFDVIQVGGQPEPAPAAGEVLVRIHASGVNPSDWKTRRDGGNRPMIAPLVIPHSDGAGVVEANGDGLPAARVGERVWTWNAQWKRAFGTAADREEDVAVSVQAITQGTGGDCVLEVDPTGNAARYLLILRSGADVVVDGTTGLESTLPSVGLMQKSIGLQFFMIYEILRLIVTGRTCRIERMLEDQTLRHTIGLTLPLAQRAKARAGQLNN